MMAVVWAELSMILEKYKRFIKMVPTENAINLYLSRLLEVFF